MTKEEILEKTIELQPGFLKEWKIQDDDIGWSVCEVFAHMLSELYEAHSHFPDKLLISYFDKLNYIQNPPIPAFAPVTFKLAENVKKGIVVPKHTKLSTEEKIDFETIQNHLITSSQLIYMYDIIDNKYTTEHTNSIPDKENMDLFSNKDDESWLYFGDDSLFNIHKKTVHRIGLEFDVPIVENGRWEYFGKEEKEGTAKWTSFVHNYNSSKLNKSHPYKTEKTEINGIKTYWVRVKVKGKLPSSFGINFKSSSDIDALFHNTTPIKTAFDINTKEEQLKIYPFGKNPQVNDLFYIASSEAFSKIGFEVGIDFIKYSNGELLALSEDKYSWEYWNSKSWKPLKSNLFTIPEDMSKTVVNGEENYWIRIRLLDSKYKWVSDILKPESDPIKLKGIKIEVNKLTIAKQPKHLFYYKNLQYFQYPFEQLEVNKEPSLYLGFSKPFEFGLISLYVHIKKEDLNEKSVLKWEIYDDEGWKALNVKDETNGFSKSGYIQFLVQVNQIKKDYFGKSAYWIRAVFDNEVLNTKTINGIYLNTINTRQSKSVNDVLLGSSNGSGLQHFTLNDNNIFDLKVWVLEDVVPSNSEYYEDKFGDGYWVLWSEINSLRNATSSQRVYEFNSSLAMVCFGDDRKGKIPPLGKDNIIVSYSSGGGVIGNVFEKQINTLVDTVAYVDSIENPIKATGGANKQSIEDLSKLATKRFKHRYRAVTNEDFYYLVKEASSNISKVSIISSKGLVKLCFIPFGSQKIPMPSLGLKNLVHKYITNTASAVASIEIIDPLPISVDIEVVVCLTDWDYATNIKKIVNEELDSFLHPITGSKNQKGWNFGQLPLLSDIFTLLNKIEGVKKISTINIFLSNGKSYSLSSQNMPTLSSQNIIYSGEHQVEVIYEGEN